MISHSRIPPIKPLSLGFANLVMGVSKGDVPDPANPPAGCKFHTRYPFATEICQLNSAGV